MILNRIKRTKAVTPHNISIKCIGLVVQAVRVMYGRTL